MTLLIVVQISIMILSVIGLLHRYGNSVRGFLPHLRAGACSQIFIYYHMSYDAQPLFAQAYARVRGEGLISADELEKSQQWRTCHQVSESFDELIHAQDFLQHTPGYQRVSRIKVFVSRKPLRTGTRVPAPSEDQDLANALKMAKPPLVRPQQAAANVSEWLTAGPLH